MSIQQLMLGVGAKKKTYLDEVFSTYLWTGTGSDQTINTGLDMASGGGMVWVKNRTTAKNHAIVDTVRGAGKWIESNSSDTEDTYDIGANARNINSFTSTGFTLKSDSGSEMFNWPLGTPTPVYTSWNFRKAKGFFTCLTYVGSGSNRTISHDLGCVPGLILIKKTNSASNWRVYHRSTKATHFLKLNTNSAVGSSSTPFNDTEPTASVFTVGTDSSTNGDGDNFVAYLFGCGESGAATARSVEFDGNDSLSVANSTDLNFVSGDFTVECWVKSNNTGQNNNLVRMWNSSANRRSWAIEISSNKTITFSVDPDGNNPSTNVSGGSLENGQWYHVAAVRDGNTLRVFVNGIQVKTASYTGSIYNNTTDSVLIGDITEGKISNVRIVKGTAVYTSSFKPPTEPLTNITNTVLLCCNNSSTTGSTVTPTTITANGDPTASTDSPFDDPAAFKFGDAEDQNVIKCGSYVGNGSSTGPEIFLGWEPQYILLKNTDSTNAWRVFDSMRGIVTGADDELIHPDNTMAGYSGGTNEIDLTSTGFKVVINDSGVNGNGSNYAYMAIRRPDGYVGKPAEAGTSVFGLTTGAGSTSRPSFVPDFPVDFNIFRKPGDSGQNWQTSARLIGPKAIYTNLNNAEQSHSDYVWDSNVGVFKDAGSDYQAWSWKRHAGFDVVTYKGNAVAGRPIPHSLSKTPEMIWLKSRTSGDQWVVGHKGLNGGTNPWHYWLKLQSNDAESNSINNWNDQAPTSTHFIIDDDNRVNKDGDQFIAMLFASVDGVSKVGYYDGSNSAQTITTGFQPRFLIVKSVTDTEPWIVLDTTRGWGSGNDNYLQIHNSDAQSSWDMGAPTSTGFSLPVTVEINTSSRKYIYYAHA